MICKEWECESTATRFENEAAARKLREEEAVRAGAAATARRQLRTQRVHRVVSLLLAAAMSVGLYALLALVLVDEALNAVISTFLPDITNETLPLGIMLENYSSTALQPNDSAY